MEPLLKIVIPILPPSVNTHYRPTIKTRRAAGKTYIRPSIFMSDEAKRWKEQAAAFMGPAKLPEQPYRVEVVLVASWLTKEGQPLRKDARNHGKLIVDALFARYGLDDKWVWDDRVRKLHDPKREAVEVSLWKYEEST